MVLLDTSEWLKAENLTDEFTLVTFVDEGVIKKKEETEFDRDVFEITVRLPDGKEKPWTMNKSSINVCIKKFGADTEKWIGQTVQLKVVHEKVFGTFKNVIYVVDDVAKES